MMLFTKEIEKAFIKQGSTANKSSEEIKIVAKLFNPAGVGTWYLYEKENDDVYWCFAELGDPMCAECGTVSINELKSLRLPFGLKIERDRFFKPMSMSLKEVMDKIRNGGHV